MPKGTAKWALASGARCTSRWWWRGPAQQNVENRFAWGPLLGFLAAIGSVVLCGCTIPCPSRTHKGEPLPDEEPLIAPVGGR
ncbi:hypothetical protein Ddc_23502 [Ditylenchus destructor]|nr:hypothetical protein Ddc_23502 [Ditylenchus destructor]